MKKIYAIVFILLFLFPIAYFSANNGYIRPNYPSLYGYTIFGIDISAYQNDINWEELKTENLSFIYIKATEGGDFVDNKFQENWNNATKNHYKTGAYHFFTFCRDGKTQAQNFISVVKKDKNALPPAIDLEFGGNCKLNKSVKDVAREVMIFTDIISKYYEKDPVFYLTDTSYKAFFNKNNKNPNFVNLNEKNKYKLWIRNVYASPTQEKWDFWQYTGRGKVNGISSFVDINVCSYNQL